MKSEIILKQLDAILESEKLNDIQVTVFLLSWQGKTYEKIAQKTGYDRDYIKDVGCRLWQKLSQKFETKVTKSNFRTLWRQYTQQELQEISKNKSNSKILESKILNYHPAKLATIQDWGEAIDVSFFVGRETELKTLQDWILFDNSRIISIVGMGGIGKSAIATRLAHNIKVEFQYIFWRSLIKKRPLEELLIEIIELIDQEKLEIIPQSISGLIDLVIKYLTDNRCLLIFDNVESILCSKSIAGKYQNDCELYGQIFNAIAEHNHQSCLIITSREKITELELKESQKSLVKSLPLLGLSTTAANSILHYQGIAECASLTEQYTGNPLALKIAATTIKSVFGGNISRFLAQETIIYGDIWDSLSEQFNRLTKLEQMILYWLTINRKVTILSELQNDIFPQVTPRKIITALESLKRRSLIEISDERFTQQPLIGKYITELMLERAEQAIITEKIDWLKSFCPIKTQTKSYLTEAQTQSISKL